MKITITERQRELNYRALIYLAETCAKTVANTGPSRIEAFALEWTGDELMDLALRFKEAE